MDIYEPLTHSKPKNGQIMGVCLKEGFSKANFIAIPLCTVISAYMGTFINTAVIFLLKNPDFYNIAPTEIGRVSNNIIFIGLTF
jgi:hypothetical protein